jgi:hypothetical protein
MRGDQFLTLTCPLPSRERIQTVKEYFFEYLADHPEQGRRVRAEFSHSLSLKKIA